MIEKYPKGGIARNNFFSLHCSQLWIYLKYWFGLVLRNGELTCYLSFLFNKNYSNMKKLIYVCGLLAVLVLSSCADEYTEIEMDIAPSENSDGFTEGSEGEDSGGPG